MKPFFSPGNERRVTNLIGSHYIDHSLLTRETIFNEQQNQQTRKGSKFEDNGSSLKKPRACENPKKQIPGAPVVNVTDISKSKDNSLDDFTTNNKQDRSQQDHPNYSLPQIQNESHM